MTAGRTDASAGPHGHGEAVAADTDLAVRWLGGSVLAASDESFGDKESLIQGEPAAFEPGHYGNRGEIVDGWETRRRRTPGHDWAIVRLGAPGIIDAVDIDTSFFTGNYPVRAWVEACAAEGYPGVDVLLSEDTAWSTVVPPSPLRGDAHNTFPVTDSHRYTHVRLSIDPDGGVARLRVLGRIVPDPRVFDGLTIDAAALENGARVVSSSDGFYTSAGSVIRPGRARTMGEGWETRRRRDDGHDHLVVELAAEIVARQVVVDTTHFKYNASESVAVSGAAEGSPAGATAADDAGWRTLLPRTRLVPDSRHTFSVEATGPIRSVRLDAFPDGGVSRLQVLGSLTRAGRRSLGLAWFDALPASHARSVLAAVGVRDPEAIVRLRPLRDDWRDRLSALDLPGGEAEAVARLLEGDLEPG